MDSMRLLVRFRRPFRGHYPRPVHGRRGRSTVRFQPRASAWNGGPLVRALLPCGGRKEGRGPLRPSLVPLQTFIDALALRTRGWRARAGRPQRPIIPLLLLLCLVPSIPACLRAPNMVYMVDEKTALEKQASGEFEPLEHELETAMLSPHGEFYTRSELEGRQSDLSSTGPGIGELYSTFLDDQERLDDLLIRRCIGEARNGLLEPTPENCSGAIDVNLVARLLQRANRSRRQVWAFLAEGEDSSSEEEIRSLWRKEHLEAVICGGQIQAEDGSWGVKEC